VKFIREKRKWMEAQARAGLQKGELSQVCARVSLLDFPSGYVSSVQLYSTKGASRRIILHMADKISIQVFQRNFFSYPLSSQSSFCPEGGTDFNLSISTYLKLVSVLKEEKLAIWECPTMTLATTMFLLYICYLKTSLQSGPG